MNDTEQRVDAERIALDPTLFQLISELVRCHTLINQYQQRIADLERPNEKSPNGASQALIHQRD